MRARDKGRKFRVVVVDKRLWQLLTVELLALSTPRSFEYRDKLYGAGQELHVSSIILRKHMAGHRTESYVGL